MSIQLAFSTVACPDWSMEQAVVQAKAMGYQGLELRTLGQDDSRLASDPARQEPATLRQLFSQNDITPVCLSTSTSLHHAEASEARRAMDQAKRQIELASAIGCQFVRFFGYEIQVGQNRRQVIQRIGERINELLPMASEQGVGIIMENAGALSYARDWWAMANLVNHPLMGVCWNVAVAAAAGESPAVSVPMLHSRIQLAKVKDAKLSDSTGLVPLGQGDVPVQTFIKRLLGVGYDGFITVEWDQLWVPSLAPASEALPLAQQTLRTWLDEVAQAIENAKPKPKPAKAEPAAKPKPAPAPAPEAAPEAAAVPTPAAP